MNTINDTEVRWGVIGAGDVCRVKSAPAMYKIPNSRLVAVMRRDGEKAKEYARTHNVPRWYDDADQLLADPEVNAVYIATPPHVHLELTRKAASAGKPVYVEKPMARTWQECREMITTCDEAGVPLFVAYYRRMLPNYLKIRELIDSGTIGEVRHVQIRMNKAPDPATDTNPGNWRVDPEKAGGGYFYDLASHQLDFLDYLLGPIVDAHGFAANQAGLYKAEDMVTGTFRFENGVAGTGSWCFTSARTSSIDETIITGSKGSITYPTFEGYYVDLTVDEPEKPAGSDINDSTIVRTNSNTIRFNFDMPEHIQQPLIETIVGELLNKSTRDTGKNRVHKEQNVGDSNLNNRDKEIRCPSTGITAARTNRVMEALTGIR